MKPLLLLAVVPLLAPLAGALPPGAPSPRQTLAAREPDVGDLEAVLERARAAAGRGAWAGEGRVLRGRALRRGVESDFELFVARDGRYCYRASGPLAITSAWDGDVAWTREGEGPAVVLALEERDSWLLSQWVHSGYWLDDAAPLERHLVELTPEAAVVRLAFADSVTEASVRLDRATWHPVELRLGVGSRGRVVTFDGHGAVAGVPLAHRVETVQSGVEGSLRVEEAAAGAVPSERLAPAAGAADTRFDPDVAPHIEVERVPSGHLLVRPTIDGERGGWFILDTGAGKLCIDPRTADELELEEFGEVSAVGIGGAVTASFRRADELALGPVTIRDPVFVELDLAFLDPVFGLEVAGICGFDLFARAVVELDLAGPSASLHDPAAYRLARGEWADLVLEDRLPCVRATFEGDREALFKIDTGDSGTVSFYAPAVESLALLEGREVRDATVGGVGGLRTVSRGTLGWLRIGTHRFEDVDASFAHGSEGAFGDADVAGSLGSELLRPFVVVFDYPGRRIALVPRSAPGGE